VKFLKLKINYGNDVGEEGFSGGEDGAKNAVFYLLMWHN
jgi:hypothetical protein